MKEHNFTHAKKIGLDGSEYGDILNAITGHKNVVEWNETAAMWTLDGLQEFMMRLPDGAIFPVHQYSEIIGNIYENPELLN